MTTELSVLLIEDEPALAEAVTHLLTSEGLDVTWVADGDRGYEALTTSIYDVAIVDVLLPGRNGFLICRDVRAAGVATPILMLTAKTGPYDEAEALEYGADDFMSKPFEPVVLLARIRALVRRGRLTDGADDLGLRIDCRRNQISYGGTTISLSPREAQLVAAIAAGGDQPVAKDTLLEQVWGGRGDANTVEVYVGYLRKKLRSGFGDRVRIDTVRWAGYQLHHDD